MSAQPNPTPATPEVSRTFFTVEVVHGASPEMNNLACTMIRLGVESAIACARVQLLNRKHAPEIVLRYDGDGARHVCAFAEKHAVNRDPKGGA